MSGRLIVIIPADATDAKSEYFQNFIWRVRRAIEEDGLTTCRIVTVAESGSGGRCTVCRDARLPCLGSHAGRPL